MDIYDFSRKLNQLSSKIKRQQKTMLEVGGKGYFENPTSDLLAFFCDPQEEHEFGDMVLGALIKCLPEHAKPDLLNLASKPMRELSTNTGRIDLMFEGDDWILTIENKIYHNLNNDFEEYENYIKTNNKDKKKLFFAVLAPFNYSHKVKQPWISITYSQLIFNLKSELSKERLPLSKWTVFLDEFINTLEHIVKGENTMANISEKQLQFIESNILEAYKTESTLNDYFTMVKSRQIAGFLENIMGQTGFICNWRRNWNNGMAYHCTTDINKYIWLYIVFNNSGYIYIQYYINRTNALNEDALRDFMMLDSYEVQTEGKTWYKYKPSNQEIYRDINELEIVLAELSLKYNEMLLDKKWFK